MLSDIEIAQRAELKPIREIAEKIGIPSEDVENYGQYKAKISLKVYKSCGRQAGRQINSGDGYFPHTGGRRKNNDNRRSGTSVGTA